LEIDSRMAVAAFRWNIIGPLVVSGLCEEERKRYRRQILEREHYDPVRGPRRIHSGTLRRWMEAHKRGGMAGLCPHQRSDKGRLVALSEEVVQRAIELRREAPRRSVKRLVELLGDEFPTQSSGIRRSTLDRHLRARGWSRATLRTTAGPHVPFEMSYRNAMWTGDVLHGPDVICTDGVCRAKIFGWVDDYSRLCVHLEAYDDERLPALENSLQKAMLKFGLPERLFVDNALIFSSVQMDLACADLGITKIHSTPGYAPSRGKIERLFRTVRDELLCEVEALPAMSLEELNRYLTAWVNGQYNGRLHSRTGKSPLDRWEQSEVAVRTVTPLALQQAFLLWARRKVGTTGEVKLAGNLYYADPTLAGLTVMLRYDPFDLGQVWLWREGEAMRSITPTHLITRVLKRPEKAVEQKQSRAARRYLQGLSDTYQQQLAREMHLIRFADLPVDEENEEAN
jgi:transposase InsO family protein